MAGSLPCGRLSTRRLVLGSEETAKRELRAYIGLVRNDMNFERHEFIIVVKNSGQTPDLKVRPFFNMQWYGLGGDMPPDFAFADYPQSATGSGPVSITPGQAHEWSFQIDWEKFQQFNSRQLGHHYLYGQFEYFDVFGKGRISEFCYQAVRFEQGGAFRVPSRHNDMT